MPEIRITDEQMDRFDDVRREIADAYVDEYGHVRDRDVVAYLLDTYTPPEGVREAGASDDAGTVGPPGESGDAPASPDEEPSIPDLADGEDAGGDDAAPPADGAATGSPGEADHTDGAVSTVEETVESSDSSAVSPMSLLDEHDGKWRRTESGEAPYEVDLPDGTTESARTKDDVRRVLFQHY